MVVPAFARERTDQLVHCVIDAIRDRVISALRFSSLG
jgi:hypothetical protein